jgi:hypothetical protein
MEEVLMEATGIDARVQLLRQAVRIKHIGIRSFLSGANRFEKDILFPQIVSVELKKAAFFSNGYIEFVLGTHRQRHDEDKSDFDTKDAIVSFRPGQQRAFEALRDVVEAKISGNAATSTAASKASTDLDELDKLASLRDRGVITEDEFVRKKKQLLGL